MKIKDKNQSAMFQPLLDAPLEVSRERALEIIATLPSLPPKTIPKSPGNFLNFKNIIMITIPALTSIVLLFNLNFTPISPELNSELTVFENIESEASPAAVTSFEIEKTENSNLKSKAADPIKENVELQNEAQIIEKRNPFVEFETTQQLNLEIQPSQVPNVNRAEETDNVNEPKFDEIPKVNYRTKYNDYNSTFETTLPQLSDRQIRRLKRELYKNLVADKLIRSKDVYVIIKLPGEDILINDKPLSGKLLDKYSEIVRVAGTGSNRRIEMDKEFIKVGDFTENGFKGHGIGTFTIDTKNKDYKIPSKVDPIQEELGSLDDFAKVILTRNPKKKGKKSLLSVNVKTEACYKLHDLLYKFLLKDGFITNENYFAIIELPKNKVLINGTHLKGDQYEKYSALFQEFNIESGNLREIRLSKRTIRIGDFKEGEFSGTQLIIPLEELFMKGR